MSTLITNIVFDNFSFQNIWTAFLWTGVIPRIITWHTTWFVNSLAHWLGDTVYGSQHTARNHILTGLLTLGEGYHNYHHEFPFDYRNGVRWYEYDPTKWFIAMMSFFGLAYDLKRSDENSVKKGKYVVDQEKLEVRKLEIEWPKKHKVQIDKEDYLGNEKLIAMNGNVYNVSNFMETHPGGSKMLKMVVGKEVDYVEEMFKKYNQHSQSAKNLMEMMKIGELVSC